MKNITTIQLGLTPGFNDIYYDFFYESFKKVLCKNDSLWNRAFEKYLEYQLTFYIITKEGNENLRVKGPSISRKQNLIDFSIFLPDKIKNSSHYLELVFAGISLIMKKYKVEKSEIEKMKNECKRELGMV